MLNEDIDFDVDANDSALLPDALDCGLTNCFKTNLHFMTHLKPFSLSRLFVVVYFMKTVFWLQYQLQD